MGTVINVQLSAFSNNKIEPNAEIVSGLMDKLNQLKINEFLPNVMTGQKIDIKNGRVINTTNLGFFTADRKIQIFCRDERIDCVFSFSPEDSADMDDVLEKEKSIIELILRECRITSNRLALNINLLSDPYVENLQNTSLRQGIASILDFYKEKPLKEWSSRENIWYPIQIAGKPETLNVITELNMANSDTEEIKRLLCHMDINTIHENGIYRFDDQSIGQFVLETGKIASEIRANFEEMSNCAKYGNVEAD